MTSRRKTTTAKAEATAASPAKAARRGEAGTDAAAGPLTRQRRRMAPRKTSENQLFAGLEHGPADDAAQQRRLAAYARILQDAMRAAQFDEAALVRKSMLPEQVVRDALAGIAAPFGYAQYALAEPLGLDPEEVARQVAAADTATRGPGRQAALPLMPAPAAAAPQAQAAAVPADPGRAEADISTGGAPVVTMLADGKVQLTFPQPIVLLQPVADALLSLLKFRLD